MNDCVAVPALSPEQAWQLQTGALYDPFAVLGRFETKAGSFIRTFLPGAYGVDVVARADGRHLGMLSAGQPEGLFTGWVDSREPYRFRIHWPDADQDTEDPYSFGLLLSETDLHLFNEGR